MGIVDASGYGHLYIPLTSKPGKSKPETNIFLVKKAYCCVVQDFWKKENSAKQIKRNLFCHLKITSKLWRTWSLALPVHNFFSHLYFLKVGEIMLLKYGHLMLPAGYILDLYCVQYCVWLSNTGPFCENYTKLYFDTRHLGNGLNRRGEIFGAFFSKSVLFQTKSPFFIKSTVFIKSSLLYKKCSIFIKNCPFWLILNAALNF